MELSSTQNALETASTIALDIITVDVQVALFLHMHVMEAETFSATLAIIKLKGV